MATSMIAGGTTYAVAQTPPPLTGADVALQGIASFNPDQVSALRTPTLDTFTVNTQNTIINFTPFDTANGGGPITFLNSGATALFQSDANSGLTNFTVLNRIIPTDTTRAIRFDGTVQSRINAIETSTPGGTILFYSPGGILAGSQSVFDVGSLVLSAADIGFGTGNTLNFTGAAAGTAVNINAGAQILAQGAGSYVALVAPQVIQAGTVKSDGSVAYIAAQAVSVTIQGALFDINFVQGQGTDTSAAITHTGTTEFTQAPESSGPQRIYVAAVPKNDAITTLVSGSLGYAAADNASVENGKIVLSAGRNVIDTGGDTTVFTNFSGNNGATASITIGASADTIFNSAILTNATGDALIVPSAGTTVRFNQKVGLNADRLAEVRAVSDSSAIFTGDLSVTSNNLLSGAAARVIALGDTGYGNAGYGGNFGTVNVGGGLIVNGGNGLTAVAELAADLGHISVSGDTMVSAASPDFGSANNGKGRCVWC